MKKKGEWLAQRYDFVINDPQIPQKIDHFRIDILNEYFKKLSDFLEMC